MTEQRREKIDRVVEKRQFNITVVMENVNDPHNIAAVMRTCDAIGIQEIFILNTLIPTHKKRWGKKSSSSASKWIDVLQFDNAEECFSVLRKKYHKIYATFIDEQAKDLYSVDFTDSCAIVFGNEHSGVSPEVRSYADDAIIIPQVGMISSLNISVACAVTLYEAFRQKRSSAHYEKKASLSTPQHLLLEKWLAREYT